MVLQPCVFTLKNFFNGALQRILIERHQQVAERTQETGTKVRQSNRKASEPAQEINRQIDGVKDGAS